MDIIAVSVAQVGSRGHNQSNEEATHKDFREPPKDGTLATVQGWFFFYATKTKKYPSDGVKRLDGGQLFR